ncbi:hypothetical protein [Microbulbifer litoralis]|uniref:hypothetical protein n=1 Tax=Microbulbifer litoralis TaxID=2933965 RepID=UPI0020294EB4|nr:hypothetical protein [Microbulbifer sp. GX H0434]
MDNNTDSLALETDLGFDFVSGGSGAGVLFADNTRLGYDGSGNVAITSAATDTIGGALQANRADLIVAGDVDVTSDVNVLDIQTSGADIDISVLADGDLIIDQINAGRGSIALDSANVGALTAVEGTYGDTHLTAGSVRLGLGVDGDGNPQQWGLIGSEILPLFMDVTESVEMVSVIYYEPQFVRTPAYFLAEGEGLQSVAGAQSAQGLKSAVQNAVEDFAQVDPGIFNAVNPYSTGVDAVNTPEMQLTGGELQPVGSAAGAPDDEDERRRSAELEGDGAESAEQQSPQERSRAALAPGQVGG